MDDVDAIAVLTTMRGERRLKTAAVAGNADMNNTNDCHTMRYAETRRVNGADSDATGADDAGPLYAER